MNAYFKFQALPEELRKANKIRSKARLDCILFSDKAQGGYQGLLNFVNHKGQLYFYKAPAKELIRSDSKRIAEWMLTNNSQNFSSIYIEDLEFPEFGYGYPNSKPRLASGLPNPQFQFRNDGYLFIVNKDYSEIELIVVQDGRNLISSYYQKMIDGGFDLDIERLRSHAKPFYQYAVPA